MKVKILNTGSYMGMDDAVGKIIPATPLETGGCCIYGRDLIAAGAIDNGFFRGLPYVFSGVDIEVVEAASPDETELKTSDVNALLERAIMGIISEEPDPFDDVFDGEI